MTTMPPRVFVSYSHDDEQHKDWVRKLAGGLRNFGIDVILDQWDIDLGGDLTYFMENSVSESDRVLCICTDEYNRKANSKSGGVGFESTYIRGELFAAPHSNKMIPIVRNVTDSVKLPRCLSGRTYINFSNDVEYRQRLEELLRALHGTKEHIKPQLGTNPFEFENEKKKIDSQEPDIFFMNASV